MRGVLRVRNAHVFGLCSVDLVAQNPSSAAQALPECGAAAVAAASTGGDARDQHAVAGLDGAHPGTDLLNGSNGLVAEDPSRLHRRHITLEDVQIGAAD